MSKLDPLTSRWPSERARFLFREINDRGYELPLASVTRDGGVEFRSDLDISVWNPGDDISGYKRVLPGDFVIGLRSFQSGLGCSPLEGLVSPAYSVLRPRRTDMFTGYYRYLLKSEIVVSRLENISQGIRQGRTIAVDDFNELPLPLPPLSAQRAIADYLDRETARIGTLIASKRRMTELMEARFARQTSALLFDPKTYHPVRLKFLSGLPTSGNRDHGSFTYTPEGVPCLRGVDLSKDYVDLSTVLRISAEDNQRHVNTQLHVGDLVIVRSGATAGRSALVTRDLDGSNCVDLVIVRKSLALEPRYLAYVVRSREIQDKVLHESSGALQPHFNAVNAGEILVPMRPLDDQNRVARKLDDLVLAKERMVKVLVRQIDLLQERRQALITACVTGKLDIPEIS
jgi:type I restriction enzyme S subunit